MFGNVSSKLKAIEELNALDIIVEDRVLLGFKKERRKETRGEAWKLYRMVEWLRHKKYRLNWSLNGDKNTRFFHVFASSRQSRNMINSITVNRMTHEEPHRVKHVVFLHFKSQFIESWAKRPILEEKFK